MIAIVGLADARPFILFIIPTMNEFARMMEPYFPIGLKIYPNIFS